MSNKFLETFLDKNISDINGKEYAILIDQIHFANKTGMQALYKDNIIEKIIQIFLKDHHELFNFSTLDQLKLLKGFDSIMTALGE